MSHSSGESSRSRSAGVWSRHPLVRPEHVVDGLVARIGPEGVLVEDGEVVVVEVAVIGQLPVGPLDLAARGQVPVSEVEVRQHLVVAGEEPVEMELGAGGEPHEDHSGALAGRKRCQAEILRVDRTELAPVCDADQTAPGVVGPAVIGAREPACCTAAIGHHDRSTVAAHVDEGLDLAVAPAGDQDGDTDGPHRLVGVRFGQLAAQCHHQRDALEDLVDLELPPLGIRVVGCGHEEGGRLLIAEVRLGVGDVPLGHRHQLWPTHRTLPRSCRSLRSPADRCQRLAVPLCASRSCSLRSRAARATASLGASRMSS